MRGRVAGDRDAMGERRRQRRHGGVRREDEDDLVDTLRDALEGVVDERAPVERCRSPCRCRSGSTRRRRGRSRRAASRRVGGRGGVRAHALERLRAEDVAGVGPAEDPAPVEVLEQHEDVAAARAGLVAERGRGERRLRGQLEGAAGEVLPRRRGPGEVVLEADDALVAFERLDAVGRAAGVPGRGGQRRRGRRRRARPRAGPSPRGRPAAGPAARPGSRSRSPSRASAPSAIACVDDVAGRRARPPSRSSVARRRARIARSARRAGSGESGATRARRHGAPGRRRSPPGGATPATSGARRTASPSTSAPWRSSRAAGSPAASAAARSGVRRRREIPRGGSGSRTTPPPAVEPGEGWRSANRSPAAAAIGRARRRIASDAPVREVDRLARPADDERVDLVGPEVQPEPIAVDGHGRRGSSGEPGRTPERDEDPGRRRPRRRSAVRTAPRSMSPASTPPSRSAVRPPVAASTVADRTWTSRMRTSRSPGTSRSVSPGAIGPPRRLPVTTVPRPRTAKTRSIGEPSAAGPLGGASRRRRARRAPPRTSSIPSPVCADASSTGTPASDVRASSASTAGDELRPAAPHRARGPPSSPPRARAGSRARRAARDARASARSARRPRRRRAAPRRSRPPRRACCRPAGRGPGTSTKSITAPVVERQVRVPDVDRHPAPPLLGQPVRVDAGERAEERRLAVVDVPGRADDEAGGRTGGVLSHRRRRPGSRRSSASSSAGSIVRRSTMTSSRSIRPTTAGEPARSRAEDRRRPARERDAARRQRLARQRAAADRRLDLDDADAVDRLGDPPAPARSRASTETAICRQTGISRTATPARYSPSVAATAARIVLSGRIARASGSRRSFATRSARPTTNPACGPPTSLSPLNVTRSAPAASRSAGVGSWARPNAAVSSSAPEPRSSTTIAPCACAAVGKRRGIGRLGEPLLPEVRRMDAEDEPAPCRQRAPPRSPRRGSGSSSRPRPASRRPAGRSPGSARRRRSRPARRGSPRRRRDRPARPRARAPPRCSSRPARPRRR